MLSRDEYAAIVEHAPMMIWRANSTGACDYFNERWLAFRGRTLEQEAGDGWTEGIHPGDLPECHQKWNTHFAARRRLHLDYRLLRHDGEYCWVHGSGSPVYDITGSFAGFIGTCIEFSLLAAALSSVEGRRELKSLGGLLSLCSWCHRVQTEEGSWQEMERYIAARSSITLTHGICPDCAGKQTAEAAAT